MNNQKLLLHIPFLLQNTHVKSILVEVNRALYMDQATGQQNAGFKKGKDDSSDLLKLLARSVETAV